MSQVGPLVPDLYRRLEAHFGSVIIANQQEEMIVQNAGKLTGSRLATGGYTTSKPNVLHYGEYYRICCPKCQDTRYRLWVNHRAVEFPWFIVCYNEDCYKSAQTRDQLLFTLYKTRRPQRPKVNRGRRDSATLQQTVAPGVLTRLDNLPMSHPANAYLSDERGFDPWELGRKYSISYCGSSVDFPQCSNKIIIPIHMNGALVGWQARFIGERNWKMSSSPKYWDKPGMPKRLMLYNHDQAVHYPWVGLQEGVTDVWATGPMMMSLLGSTITFAQRRLLAFDFRLKPIVVMLDGEAQLENEAITAELKKEHQAGVVMVTLPEGVDPGSQKPSVNLDLIYAAADQQQVVLPGGVG